MPGDAEADLRDSRTATLVTMSESTQSQLG